jgi:hypothetical protein
MVVVLSGHSPAIALQSDDCQWFNFIPERSRLKSDGPDAAVTGLEVCQLLLVGFGVLEVALVAKVKVCVRPTAPAFKAAATIPA